MLWNLNESKNLYSLQAGDEIQALVLSNLRSNSEPRYEGSRRCSKKTRQGSPVSFVRHMELQAFCAV